MTWSESAAGITAANAHVRFRLNKAIGALDSLQIDGQELLGHGGSAYFDLDGGRIGHFVLGHDERDATTYAVHGGTDFVDVAMAHAATPKVPFTIRHHYVLRRGERGLHLATEFGHSAALPEATYDQTRFVLRGDPTLFTHASVEDDPFGKPWRRAAAMMPNPTELTAKRQVQDATYDLEGLNSAYPKRYYTKYDWAVYQKDHTVHGIYGSGYGAWICQGNKESLGGGPLKQDLTVHQTDTTPVLLNMLQSVHYGSKPVVANGEWSKTYGPFFLALNRGDDPEALRADASGYAAPDFDVAFYDTLGIPGYATSSERGMVAGRIGLAAQPGDGLDGDSLAGTTIVLSENGVEFQRASGGYQYWTGANADGSFRLTGVRPGTYRLSAYRPGTFGEFQRDDVAVTPGATITLPPLTWTPRTNGTTLWQIGTPDRTATEFRHGGEFRNYGLQLQFGEDFPQGVDYAIGRSTARQDWNYVQYKKIGSAEQPEWKVRFDLEAAPPPGAMATLAVALAAAQRVSLSIAVNGSDQPGWSIPNEDSSSVAYRSGASGLYLLHEFAFRASLLRAGENTITFQLGSGSDNVLYDAIRLEVDAPDSR